MTGELLTSKVLSLSLLSPLYYDLPAVNETNGTIVSNTELDSKSHTQIHDCRLPREERSHKSATRDEKIKKELFIYLFINTQLVSLMK